VDDKDMDLIMALVEEHRAERIVVGLPRSMNGTIGAQADVILSFSAALAEHVDIPVDTWDERLSTVTAERLLMDTGMKREKRKGKLDAMAAAIILQAYLDGTNK
jgi:putative Holliday junction resolvase